MGTKILAAKRVNTDEGEFAGMRHVTRFKTVVEDLAKDKLDMNEYPSVLPMPAGKGSTTSSLRGKSLRPSRHGKDAKGQQKSFDGPRVLVFVAGGMSYSELRGGYEIMSSGNKEIIMGSTSFISPANYIENPASLGW